MAIPKVITAQTDFTGGEIDVSAKRNNDNPLVKTGGRQMSNWRQLNTGKIQNRPGRSARAWLNSGIAAGGRVEEVTLSPGNTFVLEFVAGFIIVCNSSYVPLSAFAGSWTAATLNQIVWAALDLSIYITFPGMQPLVVTWDGVSTWSSAVYAEQVTGGGQKRTAFYRISQKGLTLHPSGCTGAITVQCSGNIFTAGHVGTRLRYLDRQMVITGINSANNVDATVLEPLPGAQQLIFSVDPRLTFNFGDVVQGTVSGAQGYVISLTATNVGVQLLSAKTSVDAGNVPPQYANLPAATIAALGLTGPTTTAGFVSTDIVVGPGGSGAPTTVDAVAQIANDVPFWDEEVMNSYRGWPQSVFVDQGRLGFCNFPAVPRAIAWSAIATPLDLFVGASPNSAIFELAPDNAQVQYVIPGINGDEFVFCNNRIFFIPISETNPLKPGSVAFKRLSQYGSAPYVQPRRAEQSIIFVKAGAKQIGAVQAPGAYSRPYTVDNISELRTHLLNNPVAIAVPGASTQYEESYLYVLNSDGTLVVGRYIMKNGLIDVGPEGRPHVGWVPWSGVGTVKWVAALDSDVQFTTLYPNLIVIETLDDGQYLDMAVTVNSVTPGLAPPSPGLGPLWFAHDQAVTLIDQGTRFMGTYQVDSVGNIIPQSIAGENLASAQLVAGLPWTASFEPFVPPAQAGQDVGQRMKKRRINRWEIYVSNSSGFRVDTLAAEQTGIHVTPPGTVKRTRRISTWNMDEDPTMPPTLRERAYGFKPLGRAHDPRVVLVKDTPGPLVIEESDLGVSV